MSAEESAIQLMPIPELWPPLDQAAPADQVPPVGTDPSDVQQAAIDQGPALPRQFAVLLAEVLAGVRPPRQLAPWLSKRGSLHVHQLMPLFKTGHQPRVLRVLATRPAPNVVEMTMIVAMGTRPRALAIRLEHAAQQDRWQCTDIESA